MDTMSDNNPGPAFWERANALINLANDQCSNAEPSEVSASTLYAAARFNSFIVARTCGNAQTMQAERERALEYFTEQFRLMMAGNLDDFIASYQQYMAPKAQ
jgi:hypothetical protein